MIDKHKRLNAHFYRLPTGKEPVRDWLMELSRNDRKSIGVDIKTVEYGWPIGMPVCRPLGKSLYEIRSNLEGGRIARLFFLIHDDHLLLLHGFIKKSQKTPDKEIDIALNRKKEALKNG